MRTLIFAHLCSMRQKRLSPLPHQPSPEYGTLHNIGR
jgi:hypothetical protein